MRNRAEARIQEASAGMAGFHADGHVVRQRLVAAARQPRGPRAQAGMADRGDLLVAGPHQVAALLMVARLGVERSHDRQLIGLLGQLRQLLAESHAADVGVDALGLALHLAARLEIERIQVRHRAGHEQVDHVLGRAPLGVGGAGRHRTLFFSLAGAASAAAAGRIETPSSERAASCSTSRREAGSSERKMSFI